MPWRDGEYVGEFTDRWGNKHLYAPGSPEDEASKQQAADTFRDWYMKDREPGGDQPTPDPEFDLGFKMALKDCTL